MDDVVKEKIEQYIKFIEFHGWDLLYKNLSKEVSAGIIGHFTQALLSANINPLEQEFNLSSLPSHMFSYCMYKSPIMIPSSVSIIGGNAFAYSDIEDIEFPSSLKKIRDGAFENSTLKHLNLTHCKLSYIGPYAFLESQLLNIYLQNNENLTIASHAFDSCKQLKEIILPKSCILNKHSIYECPSLHTIKYDGTTDDFQNNVQMSKYAIDNVNTEHIECKDGKIEIKYIKGI